MKIDFWSSTEYSGFLEGLIRELNQRGFQAKQRFQISEAVYRAAKTPWARFYLRFRQYLAYPVQLIITLLGRRLFGFRSGCSEPGKRAGHELATGQAGADKQLRGGVVVVSTNTFYAPLLASFLHMKVVHLVYDLFPEAMIHSGKWREGSLKVKLVRWLTRKTLRRSAMNVFLGERLKDYVASIHGDTGPGAVIAVGADQSLFRLSPKQRLVQTEDESIRVGDRQSKDVGREPPSDAMVTYRSTPTVLYCGNFGNMHDAATLFGFWRGATGEGRGDGGGSVSEFRAPPSTQCYLQWRFHCSGPKRDELERVVRTLPAELNARIHLGGGLSQSKWIAAMEAADVALVTMARGAETVVMPSKTYSAMMAGQAILAVAPENSDLVDLIKAADCGWWVEPGDVAGLANAIESIRSNPDVLLENRERSYVYAHEHFGQDQLAGQWMELLSGC